jgi:uncharacterized membrane protein YvlD (DUF360 family)
VDAIRYAAHWILRFVVLWAIDAISLLVTAWVFPGVSFQPGAAGSVLVVAAAAAFMLGTVNLLIRPLILLLAMPLGFFVTFVVGFFVNALALLITSALLPALEVHGFFSAFLGGIILSVINTVITGVTTIDDEDSFYQGVVERLAQRSTIQGVTEPGRGLVMLELDGLSYWHMERAIEQGMMPTLKQMMREEGYVLSRVDCGLPSQTSACQAGIMFGDNHDIPAFRWFDKDEQKLYVSSKDAPAINARYAKGHGLMRGGSSINNMMDGDAAKSLLTLADLRTGSDEEKQQRARDIYLLAVNPYFLMRTIVLVLGEALLEVFQYLKATVRNVQPRLNRLHGLYPLQRAAMTVFLRDVSGYLASLDIIRGTPALYVTWPGYDEVAHHSGPWSSDAFGVLKKHDRAIRRLRDIIRRKGPRPYDLIILSDHGQSFGATFKQRYGLTLREFIEQQLPQGTTVVQGIGGDTGMTSLAAISGEMDNISQQRLGGRVGGAAVRRGQKAVQRAVDSRETTHEPGKPAQVVAYGSGNLAQVYFDRYPRRILLHELQAAYPGMVAALVQHEGIGFVAGYEDDHADAGLRPADVGLHPAGAGLRVTPVVLGKGGARNLHTGEVIGEDPLRPYGDPEFRAVQVRRVMDFPHAGDLMVVSTVYPDGTVAALEELIGSHGGMGGEQTDAFLFHPGDMVVPATSNSADVFAILNARRGAPLSGPQPRQSSPPTEELRAWAPANLARGFRHPSVFLGLAIRALVLDRTAYREVAMDPCMTGPALLIGVLAAFLAPILRPNAWSPLAVLGQLAISLVGVLVMFGAARILGGRASFTTTLRAAGFASSAYVIGLLAFIPALAPLARLLTALVAFFAIWIGTSEAHELRGWRSLLLPVAYGTVFFVSLFVLTILLAGVGFSFTSLMRQLGLSK